MKFMRFAAAALYRIGYKVHHRLFLKPGEPLKHAKLIVVGSFRAGGTGKTPFCAWLAQYIVTQAPGLATQSAPTPRIAILCHSKAQDEARMLTQKLPGISIFTTKNRYQTAHEIDNDFDYIICDDGFEDTRLVGATTIRIDWENAPTHISDLIPAGKFRSLAQDHEQPALILHCGIGGDPQNSQNTDLEFKISSIENAKGEPLPNAHPSVITGIGNPERLITNIIQFGVQPGQVSKRPDHDASFEQILSKELKKGLPIVITEKDFARLNEKKTKNPLIFIAKQSITPSKATLDTLHSLFFVILQNK